MKAYVEGYGCSLNRSETEQIRALLACNGFEFSSPEKADCIIINTCAVKLPTENRMLKRIRQLAAAAGSNSSRLVVFGCMPKISEKRIRQAAADAVLMGPRLEELAAFLGIERRPFSPLAERSFHNPFVSIIPIATGCMNNCSYCSVRLARGSLRSYAVEDVNSRFRQDTRKPKEVWLTAQDTGQYGLDRNTNLVRLLERLLENDGDYRIRLGMMNPEFFADHYNDFCKIFADPRVYRFLHIPVQSGSDNVLKAMRRSYLAADFLSLSRRLRTDFPNLTIATDVIAGFPGESEQDFAETIGLLKAAKPDITNISRYGDRPGTDASAMPGRLSGAVTKERSRKLTELCAGISLENNRKLVGTEETVFVSEPGPKGNFVGRASNYKPVVVREDLRGRFVGVRLCKAFPTYLLGERL